VPPRASLKRPARLICPWKGRYGDEDGAFSCYPRRHVGPSGLRSAPAPESTGVPGFWWGLFHGFVAPFALIRSFFNPEIRMYAAPNSGWWYDLGFVIGILTLGSGTGSSL